MNRFIYPFLAIALIAITLSGCGYTLSRTGSASGPSKGRHKACVPMFVNDTFEPLIEEELTAALSDELMTDGRWVLTARGDADLLVTGRVTGFELVPLSYDAKERILEYRLRIRSDVKVTDVKTDKVLWKDSGVETFADYRVTDDITKSKIRKGEAVRKAAKGFAEDFIIRVLDTF
ncbi:MAG: LptE family protein [Nitrospirae bacterium]|nr:LptE family protein [Nitrospirota bacterium]MBI5696237.1 LptE family protein [Nitrospirota bacterium]